MHTAKCLICKWEPEPWPTEAEAKAEAVWHMYEEHKLHWQILIGCRAPRDPDPRKASK